MRAVLVIDMPDSCEECDYCGFYQDDVEERACLLMEGHFIGKLTEGKKDERCPLKPLPKRNEYRADTRHEDMDKYSTGYADGWNDCIKEIDEWKPLL